MNLDVAYVLRLPDEDGKPLTPFQFLDQLKPKPNLLDLKNMSQWPNEALSVYFELPASEITQLIITAQKISPFVLACIFRGLEAGYLTYIVLLDAGIKNNLALSRVRQTGAFVLNEDDFLAEIMF